LQACRAETRWEWLPLGLAALSASPLRLAVGELLAALPALAVVAAQTSWLQVGLHHLPPAFATKQRMQSQLA
jgi:hypothetical protein